MTTLFNEFLNKLDTDALLVEHLGNMANLKVGKMIDILRQSHYHGRNRGRRESGPSVSKVESRFNQSNGASPKSTIFDMGKIKSLSEVKKAYQAAADKGTEGVAFALYIDNIAVAFCKFDTDALAGSSRTGVIAFDFSKFQDRIDAMYERAVAATDNDWAKRQIQKHPATSYREKEGYLSYSDRKEDPNKKPPIDKYQGDVFTTAGLKKFIEDVVEIADGKSVTGKLLMSDPEIQATRNKRFLNRRQIINGLDDLKIRLAKYKLSKKPTVATIEEFIETAMKKKAGVVQFAGSSFSLTPSDSSGYEKISPENLLKGSAFKMSYSCKDPGSYNSLYVYYSYDPETQTIKPFKAEWPEKNEKGYNQTATAVLEPTRALKNDFDLKSMDDKDAVVKKMLTLFKENRLHKVKELIAIVRKAGHDWPELKTIEKSIEVEEKKKENK